MATWTGRQPESETETEAEQAADPDPGPRSQRRPRWRSRARQIGKWSAGVLAGVIVAGLVYQWIGGLVDERRYPPPGTLVMAGGYPLHLHCTGTGSPTVVLDTSSGGISSYWGWVQAEIGGHTRTCAYDRAGRAWSNGAPAQEIGAGVATLHALLANAGESGPFVMVGHSVGGVYSLLFAQEYPGDVAGVVLVDSAHPSQFARFPELAQENRDFLGVARFFPWAAQLGLARLYFDLGGQMDFGDLPPQAFAEVAAWWSRSDYFASMVAEGELAEQNYHYAHTRLNGATLGDLPLVVVSGDSTAGEVFPGWAELQTELSRLSSNGVQIEVPGSNHVSLVFHPEHARMTSEAILRVVRAVQTGDRVAQ